MKSSESQFEICPVIILHEGIDVSDGRLEIRIAKVESDGIDIKSAVNSIDQSMKVLVKTLVRLEVHHEHMSEGLRRTFSEIERVEKEAATEREKVEVRLRDLEVNMPTLKLTSGWVILGLVCAAGATGAALIKLAF